MARPGGSELLGGQRGSGRTRTALPWQVGQQRPDGVSGWLQPRGSQGRRLQVTKPPRQVHTLQGSRGSRNSWLLRYDSPRYSQPWREDRERQGRVQKGVRGQRSSF